MRYGITGGAGFIGSHIGEELVRKGEDVIIIDNLLSGKKELLKNAWDKIRFVKAI